MIQNKIPVFCIAIIGKNNNPLYIRNFSSIHHDLKFHFIAHTACDVVEERLNTGVKHSDLYLGLLTSIEDCAVHGYLTNTRTKFFLILPLVESAIRDEEIKAIFYKIHVAYTQLVLNPFYDFSGVSFSRAASSTVLSASGVAASSPQKSSESTQATAIAPIASLAALLQNDSAPNLQNAVVYISEAETQEYVGESIKSARFIQLIDIIGGASPLQFSKRPKSSPTSSSRSRPLPSLPGDEVSQSSTPTQPV